MNQSKRENANPRQLEALVAVMEENKEFARGHCKTSDAKMKSVQLCSRIESELNSLGPPGLEKDGWKKVWSSLKDYIKKKLRQNILEGKKTGGGIGKIHSFTPLQEKVIEIVEMRSYFETIPGTRAIGIREEEQCLSESFEKANESAMTTNDEEDGISNFQIEWLSPIPGEDSTSATYTSSPGPSGNSSESRIRKRRRPELSQADQDTQKESKLLDQQAQAQREHYASQNNALREINSNILSLIELEKEKIKLAREEINIKRKIALLKEIK